MGGRWHSREMIFHLLLITMIYGVEKGRSLPHSMPPPGVNLLHTNSVISTEENNTSTNNKVLIISHGILWNLTPEQEKLSKSSGAKHLLPDIVCTEQGIFPVIGSCREYYFCQDLADNGLDDWQVLWFTCPDGDVFDVNILKCTSRFQVQGRRPECQQQTDQGQSNLEIVQGNDEHVLVNENGEMMMMMMEEREEENVEYPHLEDFMDRFDLFRKLLVHNVSELEGRADSTVDMVNVIKERSKRSTRFSRNVKQVDVIAQSAKETCADVKIIDNYVKQIKLKNAMNLPSRADAVYTTTIKAYNTNLRAAKQNTNSWRTKNGILAGIDETFLLTKQFEPKFQEQMQRMKKRVAAILEKDKIDIESIENERNEVAGEIKSLAELLTENGITEEIGDMVMQYLKDTLEEKKKDLRRLVAEYNSAKTDMEFDEMVTILGNVKTNSIQIQEKAEATRREMDNFQTNLMQDSSSFKRNHEMSENGMKSIQQKREQNNREISRINGVKTRKIKKIREERNRIATLNSQLEVSKRELSDLADRLNRDMKIARDKQIAGGVLLIIPIYGWIAGGILLGTGIEEKKSAMRQKEAVVRSYNDAIQTHNRQVKWLNSEITSADRSIYAHEETSRRLQREMPHLSTLNNDLQNLKGDVDSLLPFLTEAIASLETMKGVFRDTEMELENVIGEATKARTKAQKLAASYFLYEIEDKMKINWEKARDKIISVKECVPAK